MEARAGGGEASTATPAEPRANGMGREVALCAALALIGGLGALPIESANGEARAQTLAVLVWLSLIAMALGAAGTAARSRMWPFGATVPASWCAVAALSEAAAPRALPTLAWALCAIAGLYFAGAAIGCFSQRPLSIAASLACVCALLIALPGDLGIEWPPAVAARLLDLSPATLVVECAGLDWMRHPSVYGPVGTDRFERAAWSGELAGPLALVLGCAACALALRFTSARRTSSR